MTTVRPHKEIGALEPREPLPAPKGLTARLLLAERARWPYWLPVMAGLGIVCYFDLPSEPAWWVVPAVLFGLTLLVPFISGRPWLRWALLLLLAAVLGFGAAQYRTETLKQSLITRDIGPTTIEGRLIRFEPYPKGGRITLEQVQIRGLSPDKTPDQVRLRVRSTPDELVDQLLPGVWLSMTGKLSPASAPVAPGAFDFQRHAYFEGLGGIGFAMGAPRVMAQSTDQDGFSDWLNTVRQETTQRILAGLDGPENTVAAALMTGERRVVPEPILQAFRDSGIAHLLAISGLHLGLIVASVFFMTRATLALMPAVALRLPVKKIAALVAALCGIAYALIAGGTVPTVRAASMAVLILIALSFDRRALTLRLVAVAAGLVLITRPETLTGASFQMSFAAVVALVAFYEWWTARQLNQRNPPKDGGFRIIRMIGLYALGVVLTTLIASAATAPFAAHHFNRVADYGLVANFIAVPVTALWVMPAALVAFAAMPFGLEHIPLHAMGWGLSVVIQTAETVASWPGSTTSVPSLPTWSFGAAILGALWLCLWSGRWRWFGAAGAAASLTLGLIVSDPPDVLISGNGQLFAARDTNGALYVSTLRRDRFTREAWLRFVGSADPPQAWPSTGQLLPRTTDIAPELQCGDEGCRYSHSGKTITFAAGPGALVEDCWRADVVVAPFRVRTPCASGVPVIDSLALAQYGAHAVWIKPTGVLIKAVNETRGNRPWVIRPQARAKPLSD